MIENSVYIIVDSFLNVFNTFIKTNIPKKNTLMMTSACNMVIKDYVILYSLYYFVHNLYTLYIIQKSALGSV